MVQHRSYDEILGELRVRQGELRQQGRKILDLSMINPDIPPARFVLDRFVEASLGVGNHRYSVSRGILKLREAFARKYERAFGVRIDPDLEVCVGAGTKETLVQVISLLTTPGDVVLLPQPTYPAHSAAIHLAGLAPVHFNLHADEDHMIQELHAVFKESNPRLVLLNFPNNPTGMTVSPKFYQSLGLLAEEHKAFVLNDFVYGEMCFGSGSRATSLLSVPETRRCGAETYSLSKAYSIPGWRVGALVGDSVTVQRLARFKSQADYGIFLPLQIASAAVLGCSDDLVMPIVQEYHRRSGVLVRGLHRLGWEVRSPSAGASVWTRMPAHVRERYRDSQILAYELLGRAGITVTPGTLFGDGWDEYLRVALVAPVEELHEVVHELEAMTEPDVLAAASL